ncbi:MAG: hypothetical protein V7708_04635 [Oceanicoccus sp.]
MSNLMFYTIILSIASTGICVVLAVSVWLRLRSINKPEQQDSELHGKRIDALVMQSGDWANAAVNVVIGVFLGIAINGLVQLISTGLWYVAVLIVVIAAVLFFFESRLDGLFEKVFPSGIRAARKSKKVRKAPLARRLSLPAGLVFGIVLAGLGLDDRLLGWLL